MSRVMRHATKEAVLRGIISSEGARSGPVAVLMQCAPDSETVTTFAKGHHRNVAYVGKAKAR